MDSLCQTQERNGNDHRADDPDGHINLAQNKHPEQRPGHRIDGREISAAGPIGRIGPGFTRNEQPHTNLLSLHTSAADDFLDRLKAIPKLVRCLARLGKPSEILKLSAATIDRMLAGTRLQIDGQRKRRKSVGAAIRRSIPVRTIADWSDPSPGFFEMDMVEHYNGPKTDGDYLHTLGLTDIASGWTECFAMRHRSQALVIDGFDKVAEDLPFEMLGVNSDNDSAFMTQDVFDYTKAHRLKQTRSRAYKKNDQAWVEQKNGAIVRRLVGYGRLSGAEATKTLAQLYTSSRLYINFFQPSFKLRSKTHEGTRVKKLYHSPATPCDRLVAHLAVDPIVKEKLAARFQVLDPVRLLQQIRVAQEALSDFVTYGPPEQQAAPKPSPTPIGDAHRRVSVQPHYSL